MRRNREEFRKKLKDMGFDEDEPNWEEVKAFMLFNIYLQLVDPVITLGNEYFEYFG